MQTLNPDALFDLTVADRDGDKIGKVTGVFLDTDTDQPAWVTVKTGHFGKHETLVPLEGATTSGDTLTVATTKDKIKDAPEHDASTDLSRADQSELVSYYGLTPQATTAPTTTAPTATGTATASTTGDAVTRSEERLAVGTQTVESGRARLRKYVVTEQVTRTVPVSHEEVRVVREPITDAERTAGAQDIGEGQVEVILHEERPVVAKETVPVERVALATETVQGEQQIDETLRREVVDTDGVYPDEATTGAQENVQR